MTDEFEAIRSKLKRNGIVINNIYDLVSSKYPYKEAIPILINHLKAGIEDESLKEITR